MAFTTYFTRIGAAVVKLPVRSNSTLPNCSTTATLTFTASATSPTDILVNDVNPPLDTTANYYVIVAPLGEDRTNGGLTYSAASPSTGPITVTSGQGILVNIAAGNFPDNLNLSYALGVFLRKNNSDYALQGYAIVDRNGNDFNYMVTCEPLPSQTLYPIAALQTATANYSTYPELGSRVAYGCTFSSSLRTTGGVTVERQVDTVPVNADNSTQYPQPTARSTTLRFGVLQNDMKNVILANAGKYAKYTVNGGHTVETSNLSLQTAVALVTGNIPFQLILPPDGSRVQEIRYYLASIQTNTSGASENWSKTATTPLQFTVSTVNVDPLLNDVDVEISYKFKV